MMSFPLHYGRWSVKPNRVIVMDAPTGCCLFDNKFKWRTPVTSHSVCNLLRSFLQLSRDIDCGELHSAQFAVPDEQMELIVARSDRVLVALFHDVTNPAVYARETAERMIRSLVYEFEQGFLAKLDNYTDVDLKKAYNGDATLEKTVLDTFQPFEEFVVQIVSKFSSGDPDRVENEKSGFTAEISEESEDNNISSSFYTPAKYKTMQRGMHTDESSSLSKETHRRRTHYHTRTDDSEHPAHVNENMKFISRTMHNRHAGPS